METNDNYRELYLKYLDGQCTPEELDDLFRYFGTADEAELQELIRSEMAKADIAPASATEQQMLERVHGNLAARLFEGSQPERNKSTRLWPRIAAAASIILALSAGGYFILHKQQPTQQVTLLKPGTFKNDILPGDKAILTLANGKQIAVNSSRPGTLVQQGSVNIQKNSNGGLVYQASQNANTEVQYNTLTTLRGGGKHSLQLADGTLAILDAGSSITYPVAFTGKERQVKITGQVYFEVTHNAAMPFSVMVKNQVVRDLGTHFNINAYDDEDNIKTTLLEGSISVASDKNTGYTLKPGQQAVATPDGSIRIKNNVDLGVVVAWKNDLFKFDSYTSLPAVMRQLSRWYDLDVVYQGEKKHHNFGGDIPRNSKLSDVLKILEYSGVQFAVEGKKIIVYQ